MVLQITNTCSNACPHCLQNSTPEPQHMTTQLFYNVMRFVKYAGSRTLLISGGEPTAHPDWYQFMLQACSDMMKHHHCSVVILATNGAWLRNHDVSIENKVRTLIETNPNLIVQVTSIEGIYPDHQKTVDEFRRFKMSLYDLHRSRISLITELTGIIALGRACESEKYLSSSQKSSTTTSCFPSAVVAAQTDFKSAIDVLESKVKLCHPLIDWQGKLHWSESWLCPSFGQIPSEESFDESVFDDIAEAACVWRPCGKCPGYKKLLENNYPKYVIAKHLLGIQ